MRSTVQDDRSIEGAILAIGNGWGNIMAGRMEEQGPENEAGAPDQACGYIWQELCTLLQGRRAEVKWVKVPSHVNLERNV